MRRFLTRYEWVFPLLLCFLFFLAYTTLSLVRHNHYLSYGFDLGIADQIVWEYAHLHAPITTIDHIPFIPELYVHVELIYLLISPFYWLWDNVRMLLVLQAAFVCSSGYAIYLLAKRYHLAAGLAITFVVSYLMFYGVQNALWFDAHSAAFGVGLLTWFLYFLISRKNKLALLFFLLTITSKENFAGITFLIAGVDFIVSRRKASLFFALGSLVYLAAIFGYYYPHIVPGGYRFQGSGGLFSKLDPRLMVDTKEKWQVYLYSVLSFSFLPILAPLYLLPSLGDLASYFILGHKVTTAQGLFLQYRIDLAPLLAWAAMVTIARFKLLNKNILAVVLIACALFVQYSLHLPLSYLTKHWFWDTPQASRNIDTMITYLPPHAAVVTQDNILPHVSERYNVFTLWPQQTDFPTDSPCGQPTCWYFRWAGNPTYLLVDTSPNWNIQQLLADRDNFIQGIANLQKEKVITPVRTIGNTTLYKINKHP